MPAGERTALAVLTIAGVFLIVGAGSAARYTAATAQQLMQPRNYSDAVLNQLPVPSNARSAP